MPFTLSSLAFHKSQNLVRSGVISSRSDTALGCALPFSIPLLNGSNRTAFNSGLEQWFRTKSSFAYLHIYYTLLIFLIHLISMVISQKKETQNCASFATNLFCGMAETFFEHECLLLELDEMMLLLFCKPLHPLRENNYLHLK